MTTKPGITIQPLDLEDLDQVVGGRATMGEVLPEHEASGAYSEFMASLQGAAAVAASRSALGDDRTLPDAADHHGAAAQSRAIADEHAPKVQPSASAAPYAPAAEDAGDSLGADAIFRLLGPEAAHALQAARARVAATLMPLTLFHPGHNAVQDGVGFALTTGRTTWSDDFARRLARGVDLAQSFPSTPLTDEALRWERRVLAAPMAPDILEATAPYFLTETQSLFQDRRQTIAALFAATPKIAAAQTRSGQSRR